MLANILAKAHLPSVFHQASDAFKTKIGLKRFDENDSDLPEDASAQWFAGLLYAYTYQVVDQRDYIVGCTHQRDELDAKLQEAYGHYVVAEYEDGNSSMKDTENEFRRSMRHCHDTHQYFDKIVDDSHDFFALSNWEDIMEANYAANKDLIDNQNGLMVKTWNEGVYFNAGMFYGRVWMLLAQGCMINCQ